MIKILNIVYILLLIFIISGCAKGSYKDPLIPISYDNEDKDYATVYLYTSSDFAGLIRRIGEDFIVLIDEKDFKSEYPISNLMITNSNYFSKNKISPGVHHFLLNYLIGSETAKLEGGKDYYLAVKFTFAGAPYLRFLDRENFLNETKGEKEIRLTTGIKRNLITSKYNYEIVE